MKRRN